MTCRPWSTRSSRCSGRRPTYAILKGRSHYLCRNKVHGGMPDDDGDALFDPSPTTAAGPRRRAAARLGRGRPRPATATSSTPASTTGPGGRSASPRASAWAPPSARTARSASPSWPATGPTRSTIVVTNHAMLAIDALESFTRAARARRGRRRRGARAGRPGHRGRDRRADRADGRAGRRAGPGGIVDGHRGPRPTRPSALEAALAALPEGRIVQLPEQLATAMALVRDAARDGRCPRSAGPSRPTTAPGRWPSAAGRAPCTRPPSGSRRTRRTTWPGSRTTSAAARCSRSRRCRSTACCARRCSVSARWC